MLEYDALPRVTDLYGRQRDPFTGNPMEEGQEGPNSIFYVPGMPSEKGPDYQIFVGADKAISWTEHMQQLRDAGFRGTSIMMSVTPRPQDRDRIPSPPPDFERSRDSTKAVATSYASFWRTKCNYCWAVITHREREMGFRLEEIKSAAVKGCDTCNVLHKGIRHFADMIFPSYDSTKVRVRQNPEERVRLLSDTESVRVSFDEYEGEDFHLEFGQEVEPAPFGPWQSKQEQKEENRVMDTASFAAIPKIQQWIKTCSEEHKECLVPLKSQLPRRVLEISNRRAKLIVSNGKVAPYVALSHCWGPKPIIRLLGSNIEEMQENVPWNKLSKTFQDSITVAWKLGFRYMWIDALCILQDSREDWEFHASKMAQVFADAQLTISASKSADGAGGCFSSRAQEPWTLHSSGRQVWNPMLWLPFHQEGRDREGGLKKFIVRLKIPHGLHQNRQPKEPLLKRAWVFQEQILSSRNVHFASGELYFECRSFVACECSGWSKRSLSHQWETRWRKSHAVLQGKHSLTLPASALSDRRRDLPRPNPIPRKAAEFEAYRALIEAYTCLEITNPHDRLPALSGITSGRKDVYLAGLWKSILLESLHWYPLSRSYSPSGRIMAYRPNGYRAPTWSWASIESPIRFEETNFHWRNFTTKAIAEIQDVNTVLEGIDPRGRVRDGVLKIHSPMTEATVHKVGIRSRGDSNSLKMLNVYQQTDASALDPSLIVKHDDRELATYAILKVYGLAGAGDTKAEKREVPNIFELECLLDLPLCCARVPPAEVILGEEVTLLVLSSITCWVLKKMRTRPGYYKRVGMFKLKDRIFFRATNDPVCII
ncbi:heterokaryon incompatibility protein-domain-containing protein [Cadophora sp. MPI-SDFR-AT-0126]|nr:heterokaryon incompatibility protein-domain-containing protein [Leotiomycetes sp. MPI-SDFR-AT-0126]